MNWLEEIKDLKLPKLAVGAHAEGSASLCAMEMVAYIERLPHSDQPNCTCPTIAMCVRRINDALDDPYRQRLLAYLPRLVGTVSPDRQVQINRIHAFENALFVCLAKVADVRTSGTRESGCWVPWSWRATREIVTLTLDDGTRESFAWCYDNFIAALYMAHERMGRRVVLSKLPGVGDTHDAHVECLSTGPGERLADDLLFALDAMLAVGPCGRWSDERVAIKRTRELAEV